MKRFYLLNLKNIDCLITVTVCIFLLFLPFQVWEGTVFPEQTGKVLLGIWFSAIFFALLGLKILSIKPIGKIYFYPTDLVLFFFVLYLFIHISFIRPASQSVFYVPGIFLLSGMYLLIRQLSYQGILWILLAILISGLGQLGLGLLQYFSIVPSFHSEFKITGTFFNPAPYTGYLTIVLPIIAGAIISPKRSLPFGFTRIISPRKKDGFKYLLKTILVLFLLLLFLTRSRAAWLAVLCSGVFLFTPFLQRLYFKIIVWPYPVFPGMFFNSTVKKTLVSLAVIFACLCGGYKLYQLKPDSVAGRWLIWKNTLQMIKDCPEAGVGVAQFKANYMHYQARYFRENNNPEEQRLADNTIFAFNELLRVTAELGIPGLLLASAVLSSIFLKSVGIGHFHAHLAKSGIVSLFVFSMLSYPFSIPPLCVLGTTYLALVANHQQPIIEKPFGLQQAFLAKIIITTVLTGILFFSYKKAYQLTKTCREWTTTIENFNIESPVPSLLILSKLYPLLKTDGPLISIYGSLLIRCGQYAEAKQVLAQTAAVQPASNVYLALGDCYRNLGQFKEAEKAYKYALQMVPSRTRPVYLLAVLYADTGRDNEAVRLIENCLSHPPKKRTVATYELRYKLARLGERIKQKNEKKSLVYNL